MAVSFYKCAHCGKIVALVNDCGGKCPTLCCGEPMKEMIPNTLDGAKEKHIPVYEVKDNIVTVKVGEVAHPMMEEHHIEWVTLVTDKGNQRKILKPGDAPVAQFALLPGEKVVAVLEYCNLHGLYQG